MTLSLVVDTETTGFRFAVDENDTTGARVVQVAAALYNTASASVVARYEALIFPMGWEVPPEATAIHGITTADLRAFGFTTEVVADALRRMIAVADEFVAYGCAFDANALRWLMRAAGFPNTERLDKMRHVCVKELARAACKIPPTERMQKANIRGFKAPTLTEAYRLICGKELAGAHGAYADMRATLEVWRRITG